MRHLLFITLAVITAGVSFNIDTVHARAVGSTGTIVGHVTLTGPSPGNPLIRMGVDPQCASLNAGARPIQAIVVRSPDGGLANALVDLEKTLPGSKPPTQAVTIEQQKCVYTPRVIGARVGQILRIKNDDAIFHNVHSASTAGNDFNFSQPSAGLVREIVLKGPDVMLRVKCDVHSWMISYIAVEPHQYFAVSGEDGSFVIADVPAGRHSVHVWHERYGELTQMVTVAAGQKVTADFAYTGQEKPGRARMQEVVVPAA
jgi:hypothetical protein